MSSSALSQLHHKCLDTSDFSRDQAPSCQPVRFQLLFWRNLLGGLEHGRDSEFWSEKCELPTLPAGESSPLLRRSRNLSYSSISSCWISHLLQWRLSCLPLCQRLRDLTLVNLVGRGTTHGIWQCGRAFLLPRWLTRDFCSQLSCGWFWRCAVLQNSAGSSRSRRTSDYGWRCHSPLIWLSSSSAHPLRPSAWQWSRW